MPSPRARAAACFAVIVWLSVPAAAPATPADADAIYSVTFDVSWSAVTHPQDFPANAHFSGLVGGTHDATVEFWAPGTPASLGIRRMAEWGQQTTLAGEVQAAVDAGSAGGVILGPAIASLPGSAVAMFTATPSHHLVTLTTMIAPSPDWFVGVRGLELRPGGQWLDEVTVTLYPYDAGTDSGVSYASADLPTTPPVPVFAIAGAPFSPGVPLGTFTFRLQSVATVPPERTLTARAWPNPFNPRTTIAWQAPAGQSVRVAVFDTRGRLVRELSRSAAADGNGLAIWDGRDDVGRLVAAGSYIYTVEAGAALARGRLTLLK